MNVQPNPQNQQNQFQQQYNVFSRNPMQFLASRGLNIPNEFANDPKGGVEYLLNNGMISQDMYNKAMKVAQQMGLKLN